MEEESSKKSGTNWPLVMVISFFLTVTVSIICLLLQGETKVTRDWPEPKTSISLVCETEGRLYPFFVYDNSTKKTTKINIIFKDNVIYAASLIHELYYNTSEEIEKSEAENHAAFNLKTQGEGLGPDIFEANYAKLSNRLKMSLYAKADIINFETVKYLELDWGESENYNLETVRKIYESKDYHCTVSD